MKNFDEKLHRTLRDTLHEHDADLKVPRHNATAQRSLEYGIERYRNSDGFNVLRQLLACLPDEDNQAPDQYQAIHVVAERRNIELKGSFYFTTLYDLVMHDSFDKSDGNIFDICHKISVFNQSAELILKTLALKKIHLQQSTESKDEWRVERTNNHSGFDVMELSSKLTTNSRKNEDSRSQQFAQIRRRHVEAFENAKLHYRSMLNQENLIDYAVGQVLLYIIARQMIDLALNCEVGNTKKNGLSVSLLQGARLI
ncbi:hypothetical protein TSAR_004476 [Trichomalopsis sarcophagae]|uniref:Uncharacterized protein n=1 Tax=Trichomalopsis sarcophagae TaxID=543379 RepID=A0A232EEZ5_9HYME|nr:hypothetical protein TSAR_004476 [Trichomalopsis sarcophagae]